MKPDLRPDWGMIGLAAGYLVVMLAIAWAGRTYFHMSMYPLLRRH